MTTEAATAIILILAVLAALLLALVARLSISVGEYRELTEEQDERIGTLRKDNSALTLENARISAQLSELKRTDEKFMDIIGVLESLETKYSTAGAEFPTAEPEKASPVSGEGVPPITWTFDRLPEGLTNTYRCEDWRFLNDPASEQWKLQQACMTDAETGIRFFEKDGTQYLCAALATAYGVTIGNGFEVTLESGEVFNVIHADYKHDITEARADDFGDPDKNYRGEKTTSLIEFVYDEKVAPGIVIQRGGMFIDRFGGLYGECANIVKITYEGRVWEP